MNTTKKYNIYTFILTLTRNIIDIYSIIYLYQKGISLKNIIYIYILVYFLGIFISDISIRLGNYLGYKYILIISSIITSISLYILESQNNIYLISIFLSISIFTYYPVKHYYGLTLLKSKKKIKSNIILTYIASLLSSFIVIKKIKISYIIIIIILSIIPLLFINNQKRNIITIHNDIPKNKLLFFIFEQFKIIFLFLEPLYLYKLSNTISYVGIFNILLTIASIIFIYIISNKQYIENNYKYLNILFTIILLLKINITNKILLLVLAFLEGLGIKINELISMYNLYTNTKINEGYIITIEKIFCLIKTIILCIIYFLSSNLILILHLLLIGIFILSFQYKKDTT